MLSKKEKQEMLADARSAKRREAFRKARVEASDVSLDTYLKFLDSVVRTFSGLSQSVSKPAGNNFKL